MIILGIDPGSRISGFGVIERKGSQCRILGYGSIKTSLKQNMMERLELIFNGLSDVIEKWKPDVAAIEEIFMAKNPNAAIILGQARGVAILAVAQAEIPLYEYAARRVKKGVVGTGAASKEQIQFMVKKILRIDDDKMGPDAADAIAIALCHNNMNAYRERIKV